MTHTEEEVKPKPLIRDLRARKLLHETALFRLEAHFQVCIRISWVCVRLLNSMSLLFGQPLMLLLLCIHCCFHLFLFTLFFLWSSIWTIWRSLINEIVSWYYLGATYSRWMFISCLDREKMKQKSKQNNEFDFKSNVLSLLLIESTRIYFEMASLGSTSSSSCLSPFFMVLRWNHLAFPFVLF